MSERDRETKISAATAEEEAKSLLDKLRAEPSNSAALGAELNSRYSAAPRKNILGQMRTRISSIQPAIPLEAVHHFLATQLDSVKDQTFDGHFREIMAVALELPGEHGIRVAAYLAAEVLGAKKYPPVQLNRVPRAASILTHVFELYCKAEKPSAEELHNWSEAAQPLISLVPGTSLPFTPDEATRILDAISRLDRKVLPDALLACLPSLIVQASKSGVARFLSTTIGQPFAKALNGFLQARSEADEISVSGDDLTVNEISPRDQLSRALEQILRLFDTIVTCNTQLEEHVDSLKDDIERRRELARSEIAERDERLRIAAAEHRQEVQRNSERIRQLEIAEKDLTDSIERLRADLRLSDDNASKSVVEQENEKRRRLGEVLNAPVASLRRDLEQALRRHPQNQDIRNVGIAFDALQRRLLREANHLDQTTLSRDLLDPDGAK